MDDGFEIQKQYAIAVLPEFTLIDISDSDIPMNIQECVNAIISHSGLQAHEAVQAWTNEILVFCFFLQCNLIIIV